MKISCSSLRRPAEPLILVAAALGVFVTGASAQVVFSIEYRGLSIGTPATGGGFITAADLLVTPPAGVPAYGPLPPPMIMVSGGVGPPGPGLVIPIPPGCTPPPPGVAACAREVDALSSGMDAVVLPVPALAGAYVFSVDPCTLGLAGPLAPNVATESPPVTEASADVFESLALPPAPVGPLVVIPFAGNSGIIDGNGFASPSGGTYPGLGLIEPRIPGPAISGDDVDALDIGPGAGVFPVYFSLDAAFFNACTGTPNSGSSALLGVPPGAVLVTFAPGAPAVVYAPPAALGLDLAVPAGSDDLDALVLLENGVPGFQVSPAPFAWLGGTDMLLFSVRRGSAVVGLPDSIFGAPIEPGDILVPPLAGGLTPFPGIFVAAEALGLATTRSGAVMAAELDALDVRMPPQTGLPYCFGTVAACPCANGGSPGNGCANSGNPAGANIAASGFAQVSADSVLLTASGMPPGSPILYFQGTAQAAVPLGDGLLCTLGVLTRLAVKFNDAFGSSTCPSGADPALSVMGFVPPAGSFRYYAGWYRDVVAAFCPPATNNLTNGVAILWTP